jgi:hypothetical protein
MSCSQAQAQAAIPTRSWTSSLAAGDPGMTQCSWPASVRLDDDELAHLALVFVPQQVAVEHVGMLGIGVVVELRDHAGVVVRV